MSGTEAELPPLVVTAPRARLPEPRLRIRNADFLGWKDLRISRGIDRLAADFDLQIMDGPAGYGPTSAIAPFLPCELLLGEERVVTGYVDTVQTGLEARSHTGRVTGRSKTEDLIDCTPEIAGGEFRNSRLEAIARAVCTPFGIDVVVEADTGDVFDKVVIEKTETGFAFLERLGRLRGVLLTDDALGRLVITRTGTERAAGDLVEGVNLLRIRTSRSGAKRHSRYVILAQRGGAGSFDVFDQSATLQRAGGGARTDIIGSATDGDVPRYRPRVTTAEKALTDSEARERAAWQARYHAARSMQVHAAVQGWQQADGQLWRVNRLIDVRAPSLDLEATLLIVGVTFLLNEQGTVTELELGPPDGFTPDPGQVKRREHGASGTRWNVSKVA